MELSNVLESLVNDDEATEKAHTEKLVATTQVKRLDWLEREVERLKRELDVRNAELRKLSKANMDSNDLAEEVQNLLEVKSSLLVEKDRLTTENFLLWSERVLLCEQLNVDPDDVNLFQALSTQVSLAARGQLAEQQLGTSYQECSRLQDEVFKLRLESRKAQERELQAKQVIKALHSLLHLQHCPNAGSHWQSCSTCSSISASATFMTRLEKYLGPPPALEIYPPDRNSRAVSIATSHSSIPADHRALAQLAAAAAGIEAEPGVSPRIAAEPYGPFESDSHSTSALQLSSTTPHTWPRISEDEWGSSQPNSTVGDSQSDATPSHSTRPPSIDYSDDTCCQHDCHLSGLGASASQPTVCHGDNHSKGRAGSVAEACQL